MLVGRVKAFNCDLCSYITASSNGASQKKEKRRVGVSFEVIYRERER